MKPSHIACIAALLGAGAAHAQLIEQPSAPTLQAQRPAEMRLAPTRSFYAGVEGLPPADPLAPDLWRADLKLYAGVDFNDYLGLTAKLTNPGYREGLHFMGLGPRLADPVTLGKDGLDFELAGKVTVPVSEQLNAFGTLGVLASSRPHPDGSRTTVGPAASVGATYQLNRRQTATLDIPLGPAARKTMSGSSSGVGATVKLGF